MKRTALISASTVLLGSCLAFAQDARILSGKDKDDVDFAQALVDGGFPDLAMRLLEVFGKKGSGSSTEAKAQIEKIKLDVAQEDAKKIDDILKRKDALVRVLADKEKFVETSKGTDAAELTRNLLPDLYQLIGETITSAIKKTKDDKALESLRSEGDALFLKAEAAAKTRIEELKNIKDRTEDDDFKIMAARYNYAHTLYFHCLLFSQGSGKRTELANTALNEYQEFDLDYTGTLLNYYAYIDMGLCLKELGKTDEAVKSIDQTASIREGDWEIDKATGARKLPRDVLDIVSYAMYQKMIVFREAKRAKEAVEVGLDYFKNVFNPFEGSQSMVLAKELAENQAALGDAKGARETAEKMKAADPVGIGGVWAGEILDRVGGAETKWQDQLRTAGSKLASKDKADEERAFAILRKILYDTAGTGEETEAGCECFVLMGYAYQRRGWAEEAALAYQMAAEKYTGAKSAIDALDSSLNLYQALQKVAKRKAYKERIDALNALLVSRFPNSPQAQEKNFRAARDLETDFDYAGAIKIYEDVPANSDKYWRARGNIAIDYYNWMVKLLGDKKVDEAKKLLPTTEAALKALRPIVDAIRAKTIDQKILTDIDGMDFLTQYTLAVLYLNETFGQMEKAAPVIDGLDAKWGKDPKQGPKVQDLRGRSFLAQGKIKEAEDWVNDLVKRDPRGASGPAGQLARALDELGAEKRKTSPGSIEADELWRKAAKYYFMSIQPQISGQMAQDPVQMTGVGDRFYVFGLIFNGVADDRETFVDWTPSGKKVADYWQKAVQIYTAAIEQTPDYRMTIKLGRTQGFLATMQTGVKWADVAKVYQSLFNQEPLEKKTKQGTKLDPDVMKAKGELVWAYLEWGTAERLAAAEEKDQGRTQRCLNIFSTLLSTIKPDTKSAFLYWASKYQQVRAYVDIGDYKNADLGVQDVERNVSATFDDDKYGYKTLFEAIKTELKTKLFK